MPREQPGTEQLQLIPPTGQAALERNALNALQPLISQTNKAVVKKQVLLNAVAQPVDILVSEPVAGLIDAGYGEGTQTSSLRMRSAFLYRMSVSMGFGSAHLLPYRVGPRPLSSNTITGRYSMIVWIAPSTTLPS